LIGGRLPVLVSATAPVGAVVTTLPTSAAVAVTSTAEEVTEHFPAGDGSADHHGFLPERGAVVAAGHRGTSDGAAAEVVRLSGW
jgi:hypothetical protein